MISGVIPNKNEFKNKEIIKLSKQLKGKSVKETLTNILEWQDKNIFFWPERWPVWPYFLLLFTFFLITLILPIWLRLIAFGAVVSTFVTILILLVLNTRVFDKSKDALSKAKTFLEVFYYITKPYASIDVILKYRIGVCRDYAKFAACLLRNIYPNSRIYFVTGPGHVAVGIELAGKRYILDQRLPVWTIENWGRVENKDKTPVWCVDPKFKLKKLAPVESITTIPKIDTPAMSKKISKLLGLKKVRKASSVIEMSPIRNGAFRYEDDEIVAYSFARAIKNRIQRELPGNYRKVAKVEFKQKGKDLVFKCRITTFKD